MTYKMTLPPTILPKDVPNNKAILNLKFAVDMLTGAQNAKSLDRAVRVGELMETGLFDLSAAGLLVPKDGVDNTVLGTGKNRVINGKFDYWQRGTSFPTGGYSADRWVATTISVAGAAVAQSAVAAGDVNFPNESLFTCTLTNTGNTDAAAHQFVMAQRIEGANAFNGGPVSISMRVFNTGAAGRQVAIEVVQNFGTGGSAATTGLAQKFTLSAGLNILQMSVTAPSVAGKVVGANSYFGVNLWLSAGTNFNTRTVSLGAQSGSVRLGEVQIERGATTSDFEYRQPAIELMLCQRFYEKSYDLTVNPGTVSRDGAHVSGILNGFFLAFPNPPFLVGKRAVPTIAIYAARDGSANNGSEVNSSGVFTANRAMSASQMSMRTFRAGGNNTMVAGSTIEFQWTADAEFY